jgi:hypothetical protein
MATPLKKDFDRSEELTTADLAQGGKPVEPSGPKPVSSARVGTAAGDHDARGSTPLFPNNELEGLRTHWKEIQTNFVDEPRKAVEQADGLVASAMKRLAEIFADERSNLEKQWDKGDQVSTEDLRVAFQRYRTFFDRLLSV